MMAMKERLALARERARLLSLNDPRITVVGFETRIDLECGGDEVEQKRVKRLTKEYYALLGIVNKLEGCNCERTGRKSGVCGRAEPGYLPTQHRIR